MLILKYNDGVFKGLNPHTTNKLLKIHAISIRHSQSTGVWLKTHRSVNFTVSLFGNIIEKSDTISIKLNKNMSKAVAEKLVHSSPVI